TTWSRKPLGSARSGRSLAIVRLLIVIVVFGGIVGAFWFRLGYVTGLTAGVPFSATGGLLAAVTGLTAGVPCRLGAAGLRFGWLRRAAAPSPREREAGRPDQARRPEDRRVEEDLVLLLRVLDPH